MQKDLTQAAINAALSGNWSQALEINLQILRDDTKNVDALNRLARAYAETGNLISARKYAKSALKIDPYNTIAQKCLDKWKGLKKGDTYKSGPSSAHIFLEEPGKTKIVSLLHVGSSKILARLDAGDELKLNTRGHRVTVCSQDGKYVGRVPDDLSARLRELIKHGNEYKAYIKSVQVDKKNVRLFIRETLRVKKLADIPSFSSEKIEYISFTPPELVHNKEDFVSQLLPDEEE